MIQDRSMLVEINISTWTARKQDKKVSEEVVNQKQASRDAARVSKDLMAGNEKLKEIIKYSQNVRNWLYTYTLPWSDSGQRLLPTAKFFDFKKELTEKEQEFNDMVADFLSEYDTFVSAAAFTLGDMFNRDEYPSAEKVKGKFKFGYVFLPVPVANDFRINAQNDMAEELKQQYESTYNARINQAMGDAWDRLHKTLSHISERMTDDGEERKRFHESTFLNAMELTSLLSSFNITNDPKLEEARKDLERTLSTIDTNDLKKDANYRKEVKNSVDEILSKFNF